MDALEGKHTPPSPPPDDVPSSADAARPPGLLAALARAAGPLLRDGAAFLQTLPAAARGGDAAALVAALVVAVVALQLLDFARRAVWSAARLVVRVLFWAALALLALAVWRHGPARTALDLALWAADVRAVWLREYQRWEGYQSQQLPLEDAGWAESYRYRFRN